MRDKITFIIPCYHNEDNLPITTQILKRNEKLFDPSVQFEYIFIDDGSKDNTYEKLIEHYEDNKETVKVIKLTRNFGAHNAVFAGLHYATGNSIVILAADLQDPPELIPKMFDYWKNGIKIVIANRKDREESFLQKLQSNTFHSLIRKFAVKDVPKGGFDLILFDQIIKKKIISINEKNSNIHYLITWLGYDYVNIPYVRKKREVGKSKWTTSKKIKLFIDSFVAFSYLPLRLLSIIGIVVGLIGFLYILVLAMYYFLYGSIVQGWSSLMVVILFMGSLQLFGLGIIGEYLWRTLDEVRSRPSFVVEETYL